ncbi:cytochrome P450 71D8-like [Vicia villosa]|uniref:cytochrome P450 71D8-like n=1 Tax=Vicia villosa TaxID=3911 RepID=UPI00273ADACC|nr:cytochrome P450 71D8-like [Vicia villosa]
MELHLSYFIIPFFLLFLFHLLSKYFNPKSNKLPPGPKKFPFIGNLHQLALSKKLPHHALRDLAHKYGPLMHLQLGEISTIIVSSPKLAKEVMKTHDVVFANRPKLLSPEIMVYGSKDIVFSPYGDFWRQMRKICVLELLSAKRVQSFSYIREDESIKLIQSIQSSTNSTINLTSRIFTMVSNVIARATFGDKSKDQDEFVELVKKVVELSSGLDIDDLFPSIKPLHMLTGMRSKLEKFHKRVDTIIGNIVRQHQEKRSKGKEDNTIEVEKENLVDVLLRVQQSGDLDVEITTNNIKAVIWDVFVAGTDTTATIIIWTMSELMKNPGARKKVQTELREAFKGKKTIHESDLQDLSYLKLVMKETLRLHPPSPLLVPRESSELTIIDGYEIPKNTKVIINAWAVARDPEYWNDAEMFIPERFDDSDVDFKGNNFEFIPFGAGRRICPGMSFGLASVMLPLALLLYHFNWELPNEMKHEDLDMTEHFGLAVGRKSELYLISNVYVI